MKTAFGHLLARVESYGSPVLDERERSHESEPNVIPAPLIGGEPDPDAKYRIYDWFAKEKEKQLDSRKKTGIDSFPLP